MLKEFLIKGDCNQCPMKCECPRMRGENMCHSAPEKILIDVNPSDPQELIASPAWKLDH